MYARSENDLKESVEVFGNPFCDFSSQIMPRERKKAFRWAEVIWNRLDTYRMGLSKIVRYFLTEVDVGGASYDRAKEWQDLLNKTMEIVSVLTGIGDDYLVYGNSFTSLFFPFRRYLECRSCGLAIRGIHIDYRYKNGEFVATCPKCGTKGPMDVDDRKMVEPDRIHVIRWNPHQIKLMCNMLTGDCQYIWEIPDSFRRQIRKGDRFFLDTTPREVIEAAASGSDLLLDQSQVHHMKTDNLSGVENGGWGVPPVLASFGQIYYTQLLKRFQEAVALDYLIPLRVVTPAVPPQPPGSGQDPLRSFGQALPNYETNLLNMIDERRRDPTAWFALPFPVQYGPVGGEGTEMLRPDLIEQAEGGLLNGVGVPIEFYRGNMRWRGDPQAIRLLEKTWEHLTSAINAWLDWATDRISQALGWEDVDAHLKPPSMFDDMARKQLMLQLAAEGKISMRTAMEPWDIDMREERENLIQEQKEAQKDMEELDAEQGPPPGPGAPAGPPAGPEGPMPPGMPPMQGAAEPSTVSDLSDRADQMAQYLLSLPGPIRHSQMVELKQKNSSLHALVKQKMEDMRGEAGLVADVQARQQMFGAP